MIIYCGDDYAEFKTVVGTLKCDREVFYSTVSSGVMTIQAFPDNLALCAQVSPTSVPSTFATDFPHAIAISVALNIQG